MSTTSLGGTEFICSDCQLSRQCERDTSRRHAARRALSVTIYRRQDRPRRLKVLSHHTRRRAAPCRTVMCRAAPRRIRQRNATHRNQCERTVTKLITLPNLESTMFRLEWFPEIYAKNSPRDIGIGLVVKQQIWLFIANNRRVGSSGKAESPTLNTCVSVTWSLLQAFSLILLWHPEHIS